MHFLERQQRLRDHAVHFPPCGQCRVGSGSHQTDAAPSVDEPNPSLAQFTPKYACGLPVLGPPAIARSGEDTDAF